MSSLIEGWPRRHRITVDEYYRMAEVGLLAPDARVELIEGEIIDMAPIGTDHASVVNRINRLLVLAVGDRGIVQIQGPARLDHYSEPEPDVAVFAPRDDFYRHVRPTIAETLLVVEVSHSSVRYDRDIKVPLYARHGIREVWIVDLENGELRFCRNPQRGRYLEQSSTREPGITPVSALPGVEVDLSRILSG